MTIFDLTEEELKHIGKIKPDWLMDRHPNFMASFFPEYMVQHRLNYMLENYPNYMRVHHSKIWNEYRHCSIPIEDPIVGIVLMFREKRGKIK